MKQITIFDKTIRVDDLKKGKLCCDGCGRNMRAYAKTLDKRLLYLGYDILDYLRQNKKTSFRAKDIWSDHHKINDFQKLGYWKIIRRDKSSWKLTNNGKAFLIGKRPLPNRIWVFKNNAVDWEDELLLIHQIDDRWQETRSDYTLDYINIKQEKLI